MKPDKAEIASFDYPQGMARDIQNLISADGISSEFDEIIYNLPAKKDKISDRYFGKFFKRLDISNHLCSLYGVYGSSSNGG
jgi:hypothetical protein